jgi:hypothetical protein
MTTIFWGGAQIYDFNQSLNKFGMSNEHTGISKMQGKQSYRT